MDERVTVVVSTPMTVTGLEIPAPVTTRPGTTSVFVAEIVTVVVTVIEKTTETL